MCARATRARGKSVGSGEKIRTPRRDGCKKANAPARDAVRRPTNKAGFEMNCGFANLEF